MLLQDFEARVFLHEFDHLEGITFDTRVSKFKLEMAREKQRKLERGNMVEPKRRFTNSI